MTCNFIPYKRAYENIAINLEGVIYWLKDNKFIKILQFSLKSSGNVNTNKKFIQEIQFSSVIYAAHVEVF